MTDTDPTNSAKRPFNPDGGEDEGSAPNGGKDDHLRDDQKPVTDPDNKRGQADDVGADDPHKTEKLTKAGRDINPNEGTD